MAQIRKFKNGSEGVANPQETSSSAPKPYGTLTINGEKIEVTDELLKRIAESSSNGMSGLVNQDIIDTLRSGQSVNYDSTTNQISGVNWRHVDQKARDDANRNQPWDRASQRRANRNARRNNTTHQFVSALENFGKKDWYKAPEPAPEPTKTALYGSTDRTFDYNTDSDGNKVWSNGPQNAGFDNALLERHGYYVQKDKNGNTYLYDNNGNVIRDNIYLNGFDWAKGTQWENGAVHQGRFWTEDELLNQNTSASQAFQSYVNAWNTNDENNNWSLDASLNALRNSGWIYAGMNSENPYKEYVEVGKNVLPGFKHLTGNYHFQDISSEYTVPDGLHIIRYLDPNQRNKDGSPTYRFAINDNDADHIFQTQADLENYLSGLSTPITKVVGTRDASRKTLSPLAIERDEKGNEYIRSNTKFKVKQNDGSIADGDIYRSERGEYYFKGQNGKFYRILDSTVIDDILAGKEINQKTFEKGISDAYRRTWFGAQMLGWGSENYKYRKYGTPGYESGSYDSVLGFKKGGNIPILQFGGGFERVTYNPTKTEASTDKIGTLHKVGGGPGLTDGSDDWATAATVLDTASFGTSFIPGVGNLVGAATGALGSTSRFISDIKRDGLDWGDVGRLGLNLGLDILTLIPFAGSAAKAAKLAKAGKAIGKAGKNAKKVKQATESVLSTSDVVGTTLKMPKIGDKLKKAGRAAEIVLPAIGTANGISAAVDAAKDGEVTSDEMATIAQGLISGALLGRGVRNAVDRRALKAMQKKLGIENARQPITKTIDNKKVTLSVEDQNFLKGKTAKEAKEFLTKKVKDAGVELKESDADKILDIFGLKADKKGIVGIFKKDARKISQEKLKDWDVFSKEALANKKLAETLQKDNLAFWDRAAARAYKRGLLENHDAHKAVLRLTGKRLNLTPKTTFGGYDAQWSKGIGVNIEPYRRGPLMLPEWKGPKLSTPSVVPSNNNVIITPNGIVSPQGQFLLPRGNGKFFSKTQRVRGGVVHKAAPIGPTRYTASVREAGVRQRNIVLGNANAKTAFMRSPQRFLGELMRGNIKTQDEAINYILENIPKKNQAAWLNLLSNKNGAFKELFDKFASDSGYAYYHVARAKLPAWLQFKKGGKIIKAQNGLKPGDLVHNNTNTPSYFDYAKSGLIFNRSNIDWTKSYDNNSKYWKYRNYYIDHWDDPEFQNVKNAYLSQLSKGNNNRNVSNLSLDEFKRITNDRKLGYAHNLYVDGIDALINPTSASTSTPTVPTPATSTDPALETNPAAPTSTNPDDSDNTGSDNGDSNGSGDSGSSGNPIEALSSDGSPVGQNNRLRGSRFNIDDIISVADLARNIASNNVMYNRLSEGIDALNGTLKAMPTEIYDRYQDHITPVYQEAANQKRQFIPTSTDAMLNYAMRQSNEDAAQSLLTEGRLKASEAYSNYLANDLAARRAYAEDRRNTAWENRKIWANVEMQQAQNDAARMLANSQSFQNFVMEWRNKFANDRQQAKAFRQQQASINAQNKYNEILRNKAAEGDWMNKYANDPNRNKYANWESYWQAMDTATYNKAVEEASKASGQIVNQNNYLNLDYPWLWGTKPVVIAKKGTKLSYARRHTGPKPDEAIWIQRNKDTAKALEKLHDAVIKLFMKVIS